MAKELFMTTATSKQSQPAPDESPWTAKLLQAITDRLDSVPKSSRELSRVDANKVADAMFNTLVEVIATGSPEEDLGPFYTTTGLCKRLGVTRQALDGRISRRTLLALAGDDGSRLYPAFQFTGKGTRLKVVPGFSKVMQALAEIDAEPIAIAAWVTADTNGLTHGTTAIEHLRNGGSVDQVLDLVGSDAERLEH
jgi:hypothetical protein